MKRYLRLWWKACLLDLKSCRLNKARCWAWCSHEGSLPSLAHCNRSLTSSTQKEVAHKAQRIRAVLFHKALYWRILLENRIETFQSAVLGFNLWHNPLCHKFSNLGLIMLFFWRTSANPWWATDYCQPPAWPWCWCRQVGHHDTGGIYETLNKSGYSNNLMGPVPAKYSHTRIKDSLSIFLFPRLPEEIYWQERKANKLLWRLTKAPLVWAGEEPTMTIHLEKMRKAHRWNRTRTHRGTSARSLGRWPH